jgi:LysM domain
MISRARAVVAGLGAMAALAVSVAGLPAVLYRFGGSPLPDRVPGWHQIATILSSRDDGTLALGVIRECSWLAWLLFTACILAEAQAAIRGRRAPHLRLGGLQGAAAHLVALAALTFATPSAMTLSASATALSHPGALSQPGPESQQAQLATTASWQRASPPMSGYERSSQPELLAYRATDRRLVVVQPGDCLWSIAQRYLGAGDRYPEIAAINYGHEMGNGQVFNLQRRCTSPG